MSVRRVSRESDWRLYLRLLRFARPYWKIALLSLLAILLSAALEPLFPALMQPLVDQSLIGRDEKSLWQIPLLIVVVFAGKGLADYVGTVASKTLAQKTISDLRLLVFSHQLDLPLRQHRHEASGRMLTRVTHDASMVGEAVSSVWLVLIRDTFVLIGLIAFLFYTAWKLALMVFVMAPILAVVIQKTNRLLRKSSHAIQGRVGSISALIQEALLGLQEIKIFGAHEQQQIRFDRANKALRHDQMRAIRIAALNVPLVQILAAICVASVIYFASILSVNDQLTPGEFVAFITAMSMVFEPIRRITNVNSVLQKGLAGAESIFSILDQDTERQSSGSPRIRTLPLSGGITFEAVAYSHPHQEAHALKDFHLRVEEGESLVLVGPSGSGKSTLLYLLCGFDRPQSGRILIGGQPIESIELQALRANISLVAQRTQLFDLTVRENIALGRPDATREEIVRAAEQAHAMGFIDQLPQGLETPLGALGDRLSGGQRQRIAIARAFLKDAPLLLLDEATSALDKDSEQAVLQGLQELMRGRTVIMVSHAPERLLHVDRTIEFGPV